MTDQKIDEQLRRLSRAVAETSPEPPELAGDSPRTRAVRPVRASSWSFAAALGFGAVTLLAIAWWGPGSVEPEAPVGDAADSRWDWILEHSEATDDETLRIADPSATPAPAFDYAALGTEQVLMISSPAIPTLDVISLAPFVYVGTVADTAAGAYVFHSHGERLNAELEDGTVVTVACLTISVIPDINCYLDTEPAAADGLISAVSGLSSTVPQGDVTVSMWLPRETSVAVLNLDDGRSFVQRPVAGVALFVISDLGGAAIASADARSASGEVIVHEDFPAPATYQSRWEWILAHSAPTDDESVRVADPAATPVPTFDYQDLGDEQRLVITDPSPAPFSPVGGHAPLVYLGTVADSATGGYVYWSDNGPVSVEELPGTTSGVVCVMVSLGGVGIDCHLDDETFSTNGIISGVYGLVPPDVPQGAIAVSLWLPLDTALAVLNLDDGRSFVQRPVGGMSIFVISDLGDAGIESAEALDASGHRIVVEDFLSQWEALVASLDLSPASAFPDAVEGASELVIGSVYVAELPEVLVCGGGPLGGTAVPQQGGTVSSIGEYPTPVEALAVFLSQGIGNPPIATAGYLELIEPDGAITFGKNISTPGPDNTFVTLISIEPAGVGWTVSAWEASGC
jgi:hypothetical protein